MTPQETYDKKLWWILQEIQKEILLQDYGLICVVKINFSNSLNEDSPSIEDIRHILRNQLEKKIRLLEIITDDWKNATEFVLEIDRKKFKYLYEEYQDRGKILTYKSIKLDLVKGKIQYKQEPPVDIQPDNREIKFLTLLMKKPGTIHENKYIAKELGMNSSWASNKDLAREIGYIRRDLLSWLTNTVKIPEEEAKSMIENKKNFGYKLVG